MDYFAEMEGLNKPGDSPLKGDFTKVMSKPVTSPKEPNKKENEPTLYLIPKPQKQTQKHLKMIPKSKKK